MQVAGLAVVVTGLAFEDGSWDPSMHNNMHVLLWADGACILKFCCAAPPGSRQVTMTDVGGGRVAVCSGQYREEMGPQLRLRGTARLVVVLHVSPPSQPRAVDTLPGGVALVLV